MLSTFLTKLFLPVLWWPLCQGHDWLLCSQIDQPLFYPLTSQLHSLQLSTLHSWNTFCTQLPGNAFLPTSCLLHSLPHGCFLLSTTNLALAMGTCHPPLQGLNQVLRSCWPQHPLKGVHNKEQNWDTLYSGKTGKTGLQIVIFRSRFYEPDSYISSYLEKH